MKNSSEKIIIEIFNNVISGKADLVTQKVEKLLNEDFPAKRILNQGLVKAMDVVGERFRKNECYIPEVLLSAQAMQQGMQFLRPHFVKGEELFKGKVILGTVFGDIHDIGKKLVGMMLEGAGFEIVDLGTNVPVSQFVDTVQSESAQVIGLSSLLTTTMPVMKEVVDEVKRKNLDIPVIIGGAPVTKDFANEIGAKGYAKDAAEAVEVFKNIA